MYTHPTAFIHSSINGHLDCSHMLAVVNEQSTCFQFFWVCTQEQNCWSYGNFFFNFLRNCQAISTAATPFYIPTNNSAQSPDFSTSSPHLLFSGAVDSRLPDGCKGQLTVVLIRTSLVICVPSASFMSWLAICLSSLEKSPLSPWPTFNHTVSSLLSSCPDEN